MQIQNNILLERKIIQVNNSNLLRIQWNAIAPSTAPISRHSYLAINRWKRSRTVSYRYSFESDQKFTFDCGRTCLGKIKRPTTATARFAFWPLTKLRIVRANCLCCDSGKTWRVNLRDNALSFRVLVNLPQFYFRDKSFN